MTEVHFFVSFSLVGRKMKQIKWMRPGVPLGQFTSSNQRQVEKNPGKCIYWRLITGRNTPDRENHTSKCACYSIKLSNLDLLTKRE